MAKPTKPRWADGDPSFSVEPSEGKKDTGWLSGEKPPFQFMNFLFLKVKEWIDWFENKAEIVDNFVFRSDNPVYFDGFNVIFSSAIEIVFRNTAGAAYINKIAAGTLAIPLGSVVVARLDRVNASPVTLALQGTYANLAAGQYAIVAESSLTLNNDDDEVILFRHSQVTAGNDVFGVGYERLEMPITKQIAFDQETFYLGEMSSIPSAVPPLREGCYNLSFSYSANTFKIVGANGNALSNYNVGWVVMRSGVGTSQKLVRLRFASDTHSFIDGSAASSNIDGNTFGSDAGVAWSQDRPFFKYCINKDDTSANAKFAIAVNPSFRIAQPGQLAQLGDTNADSQSWMILLATGLTLATYDGKTAECIGSFRMRKNSSDEWTVQALINDGDGIGRFQEHRNFSMVLGQFGASAGTFMTPNGGTAPVFTTNTYLYQIGRDGKCRVHLHLEGDAGADGAGAVVSRVVLPYVNNPSSSANTMNGSAYLLTPGYTNLGTVQLLDGIGYLTLYRNTSATAVAQVLHSEFSNGSRNVTSSFEFKAF